MDHDARTRSRLEQHWKASECGDIEVEHAIYTADAILDYPSRGSASGAGQRSRRNTAGTRQSVGREKGAVRGLPALVTILAAMLGLLGLRIFEATAADIGDLGEEHGHRVLRVCGKDTKVVLVPLPPAVGRAIDRAIGGRTAGRSC